MSNFYIRVNRRRFWKNDTAQDKGNAYWALYNAIKTITVVTAPITPFLSEHIWQKLGEDGLCMATDFPTAIKAGSAKDIATKVDFVQQVISQSLSLRAREQLKLKQPLKTLYIKTDKTHTEKVKLFGAVLRDEINVKNIEVVQDEDKFNVPFLVINFKRAGAVLKGGVQDLKTVLESLDAAQMAAAVAAHAKGKVTIGKYKDLGADLFERKLKSKSEFVSSTEGAITVVLDTTLDQELVQEGILRELIRSVQVARQDAKFDITARIELALDTTSDRLA